MYVHILENVLKEWQHRSFIIKTKNAELSKTIMLLIILIYLQIIYIFIFLNNHT